MTDDILVIGATSSLGVSICRQLAKNGSNLTLAGRNKDELKNLAGDLSIRFGVKTEIAVIDLGANKLSCEQFTAKDFDSVFMLAGDMGSENKNDISNIGHIINVNFTAPAQILTAIAQKMEHRKHGNIVVVSSVAGDRGRQSNYPYGSAKAGLTAFASGLRNRLCKHNVHVMTVRPGFIDTPMTYGMESPLIADRDYVAAQIIAALGKKKDSIYVPFFWRYIMLIIMHIPEKIFKKLGL